MGYWEDGVYHDPMQDLTNLAAREAAGAKIAPKLITSSDVPAYGAVTQTKNLPTMPAAEQDQRLLEFLSAPKVQALLSQDAVNKAYTEYCSTEGESITQEAHRLVTGNRGADYGHPFEDFGRTAGMISALLSHKLKEPITQEDVASLMICVKLSRTMNKVSRDSIVDIAGYAQCLWAVIEERQRREMA